jgi:hypothetical protein
MNYSPSAAIQQLVKLARALKSSPNDILGEGTNGRHTPPTGKRVLRHLRRIESLAVDQQDAVLKLIDGVIKLHAPG